LLTSHQKPGRQERVEQHFELLRRNISTQNSVFGKNVLQKKLQKKDIFRLKKKTKRIHHQQICLKKEEMLKIFFQTKRQISKSN
jgi:hypothetical protein